jgi:hypothetical protein
MNNRTPWTKTNRTHQLKLIKTKIQSKCQQASAWHDQMKRARACGGFGTLLTADHKISWVPIMRILIFLEGIVHSQGDDIAYSRYSRFKGIKDMIFIWKLIDSWLLRSFTCFNGQGQIVQELNSNLESGMHDFLLREKYSLDQLFSDFSRLHPYGSSRLSIMPTNNHCTIML